MKRIIIYIGILALLLAAPVESADIGKLIPVQVVSIRKENDWVILETDTEDVGMGASAEQALKNLKDTASGVVYLDTAEYLLIGKDTQEEAEALRDSLKRTVRVCEIAKPVDLAEAARFLSVHGKLPKLKTWEKGKEVPVLSLFGENLIFLKKVEKRA